MTVRTSDNRSNVAGQSVALAFYHHDKTGLALSDEAMHLLAGPDAGALVSEIRARWDLIEAAFAIKREGGTIENDIRAIYLANGYERRSVTRLLPVLHGYQNGLCCYCAQAIHWGTGHVDHVIPRQFVNHDEVWNLVLAHEECNTHKDRSRNEVQLGLPWAR